MNTVHYLADNTSQSWTRTPQGFAQGDAAPGTNLVVVIDFAQEAHVPTTLPMARGADAARLRRRRLEREFPSARLSMALNGRNRASDGMTDVVLIAAGTNEDGEQQLKALAERHALRSISTPALLIAEWLTRAKLKTRRLLVVLPTPAGLRVTFIDQGIPLLSRLTSPIAQGGSATEIARTVQYLQNTQRIERGEQVQILFWGMTEDEIAQCQPSGIACEVGITPAVPGLPDPQHDGLGALLEMVAQRATAAQLAPDRLMLNWFSRELARYARYVVGCIALVGIALFGIMQWRAQRLLEESASISAQTAAVIADRSGLEETLSHRGLQLEDVRLMPDLAQTLQSTNVDVADVFRIAGHVFGTGPEILLQTLEFRLVPAAPATTATAPGCANEPEALTASIDVRFSLTDGLSVRQRSNALARVRNAMAEPGPWRATPASSALGARDALVIKAGLDASSDSPEWTACLLQTGGTS